MPFSPVPYRFSMWSLLQIILPVCGLIAVGTATRVFGLVRADADEIIGDFVFKIAIPCLLFRLIATANLEDIDPWRIWGTYFISVAVVWLMAGVLLPIVFKREMLYGVIGSVASTFANTVMIGIPVIMQAYGERGMVAFTILLSVHLPVMLFATTLHHDLAQWIDGKGGIEGQTFFQKASKFVLSIVQNPILIGIMLGALVRLSGLTMPAILLDVTGKISAVAGPMALIVLGMGLTRYGIKGNIGPAFVTTFLKLMVHPALVFVLGAMVFDLPPIFTASLVITAASPAGVNSYLFAQHFGTGQALSSNSISISTVGCVLTMTFWLAVLAAYFN